MQKTRIEWTDFTWNPVTGCLHGCPYCYARRIAGRFTPRFPLGDDCSQPGNGLHEIRYKRQPWRYGFAPTLHSYRLWEPRGKKQPLKIFVGSMSDLFGHWVPREWIEAILETVKACPHHTFQFLTKNPRRYQDFNPWPANCWLGATITNQADANRQVPELLKAEAQVRFVSAEPFMGPVGLWPSWVPRVAGIMRPRGRSLSNNHGLGWLIIGAMTGPGSAQHQPSKEEVGSLREQGRAAGVPVFMKDNLKPIMGSLAREFPFARGTEDPKVV